MRPVVVMATDSHEPSGLGEHMLTLALALGERFDVVIAVPDAGGGATLLRRAAAAALRVKAIDLAQPAAFRAWLEAQGDLLHVHAGIGWEGHALVRLGKAAGLPVLRTEHLPYLLTSPVQQAEYGAMLLAADRVVAVSRAAYDTLVARHGTGQFALVPNGIAPRAPQGSRAASRQALGLGPDEKLVLTVARFTPQKGYASLLAAIPSVLSHDPAARFVWVGDGPDLAAMRAGVGKAGLEHAVTLLGQRTDVPDLLAAADVFVLPSLFEGLPLVLLEAMAVGLPVVATAIGGTLEALGEAHPFLAPPNDPAALAQTMIAALDDPKAARAAGTAGRVRFERLFRASRMADQTAELYRSLLRAPLPPAQVQPA